MYVLRYILNTYISDTMFRDFHYFYSESILRAQYYYTCFTDKETEGEKVKYLGNMSNTV